MIDAGPLLIAMTDGPEHRVALADRPGAWGDDSIMGKTMIEILPGLAGRGLDGLDRSLHDGMPVIVRNLPDNGGGGADMFDVMSRPMRDRAGDIAGLLVEVRPAGEHGSDVPALLGSVRATAVGTLASSVAHQFSQPLTAIGNYAAGLRRALRQPERKDRLVEKGLEAILESVALAGEKLGGLRALNRRGPAIRTRVDWERLMERTVLPLLAPHIPDGALRYDFSRIADVAIRADPMQIGELLITLIGNACDAVRDRADPYVDVLATLRANDLIQIDVEDNGPGIAPGTAPIIFDALASAEARNLGFGLAIGRAIVEAHGGTIRANQRDGGGASISFTLPI